MTCHIPCIRDFFAVCVIACEFGGVQTARILYHIPYTCRDVHGYGFLYDFANFQMMQRTWNSRRSDTFFPYCE